ncbi:LynF/TruF/PatF family peptide O-prenyltransferase [Microcoleus sp. F4-D5]|uniref:LynF/TruF/PatF family peptide O-prenyltransferase n=1 Tax=Microcoleus sp. F4-D5 TaxID=2818760 RepID=UPI002FD0C40B
MINMNMTINSVFSHDYLREQRLRFMRTHRDAFDVEPSFPIPLFEEAVLAIEGPCGVEPTCNVEGDLLFAGDFQVSNYGHTWPRSLIDASNFLDKVERRIDVKINRDLLDRFSVLYIGSSKIENNTIGIDLRPTLQDSAIKIYMHINHGEGNEDLVLSAIALDGAKYSAELTEVLIKDVVVIGFNLFLDGRSNIEILAGSPGEKYQLQGNFGRYLDAYIRKNFSRKVNYMFNVSDFITASFSRQKIDPAFHFHFFDIKDIPKYFAFNSLGDKIYDFCQSQDCVTYAGVTAKERDLENSRLENYSFFYNQSDTCQRDIERGQLAKFAS